MNNFLLKNTSREASTSKYLISQNIEDLFNSLPPENQAELVSKGYMQRIYFDNLKYSAAVHDANLWLKKFNPEDKLKAQRAMLRTCDLVYENPKMLENPVLHFAGILTGAVGLPQNITMDSNQIRRITQVLKNKLKENWNMR
jgi:hypothetical protein